MVQMEIDVVNTDDPPVAEEHHVTVYSGRETTFSLPAYDPDGSPVEIYILREPQGAGEVLQLTDEQLVGLSGQRRKVRLPPRLFFFFAISFGTHDVPPADMPEHDGTCRE